MTAWRKHERREAARYEDGLARLPAAGRARERQLTRMANAACGAGLACLMDGRGDEAASWFGRSAERYRESYADAPPGSWGRLVAVVKMRLLAGGDAAADATWALAQGPKTAESPIGRYAAALALLALGEDDSAARLADELRSLEDFPSDVAAALAALARDDRAAYGVALEGVLRSFEEREHHLEGIPVADTVLVLETLADRRGLAMRPASPVLPA